LLAVLVRVQLEHDQWLFPLSILALSRAARGGLAGSSSLRNQSVGLLFENNVQYGQSVD
jgi:hypothetical protein